MTQPLATATRLTVGQPSSIRVGRIVGVDPVQVSIQGAVFNDVGFLGNVIPFVGMAVNVIGQSTTTGSDPTSWLVLGPAVAAGDLSVPSLDNPPLARLTQTVAQAIPTGASTAIIFDTEDADTVSGWNGAAGYIAQVDGRYMCSGGMSFAPNGVGVRTVQWAIDGIDQMGTGVLQPASGAASQRIAVRTELLFLNAGETLTLTAFQNSGGPLNTAVINVEQASMNVMWVSHS